MPDKYVKLQSTTIWNDLDINWITGYSTQADIAVRLQLKTKSMSYRRESRWQTEIDEQTDILQRETLARSIREKSIWSYETATGR